MIDGVFIPRDIAERMVRFMNIAAGEGICFDNDRLEADTIMMDWFNKDNSFPHWVQKDIRDEWQV